MTSQYSKVDKNKEESNQIGMEFTGEGFMPYQDLVNIIKAYQQRHFCEDVDTLQKLGGNVYKFTTFEPPFYPQYSLLTCL